MVRLLVVDQHPIIRKGIELIFAGSRDIRVISTIGNGEDIFNIVKKTPIDVVLTEIDLPKINGISVLKRLKAEYPQIKVAVYSSKSEDVYAIGTIKTGAMAFIPKTVDILTLKDAIMRVNRGSIYLSSHLSRQYMFGGSGVDGKDYYKKLSTREIEVLQLLSSGRRNKDIAQELNINEKTVSTYRSRLMKKLNVDNIVDLVNQAKQMDLQYSI